MTNVSMVFPDGSKAKYEAYRYRINETTGQFFLYKKKFPDHSDLRDELFLVVPSSTVVIFSDVQVQS